MTGLAQLVGGAAGRLAGLDVDPSLLADQGDWVPRAVLAQALGVLLLEALLRRVPSGAAYVADKVARGEKVFLDHGAVRTVAGGVNGALPPGQESVTRILAPLGYRHRETYDLARLGMTGRSWCHVDLPAAVPQYFVSELHADRFSTPFQEATARVLGRAADPLAADDQRRLDLLGAGGGLPVADAAALLPALVRCFERQHPMPTRADYQLLLEESAEMAWISTEGTAFNHATDRVADVDEVAAAERAAGRPIKDTVEVSASGRIRQTAHRAAWVARTFGDADGSGAVEVPGSFFEFIARAPLPDGSGPDLAFDAANAQGIFTMTRPR